MVTMRCAGSAPGSGSTAIPSVGSVAGGRGSRPARAATSAGVSAGNGGVTGAIAVSRGLTGRTIRTPPFILDAR